MRSGYELFSFHGIAVRLHGSFLFLAVIMVILALGAGGTGGDVGFRLLGPLLLLVTVLLHEVGHAVVANALGVHVIDVVLTPLGGMARLQGELKEPRLEGFIALAGPTTNLILAAITFILMLALGNAGDINYQGIFFFLDEEQTFLKEGPFHVFFGLNLLLGVFNLIPAFPSDGGRILRALLAHRMGRLKGTRLACRIGIWLALTLILLPFFAAGEEWWITPFIGLYVIFACLKERFFVEAREGMGRAFFSFGRGPMSSSIFGGSHEIPAQEQDNPSADRHDIDDQAIIDVAAETRIVDEDEEG